MGKRAKASFDPKRFLARVGDGKSIANYLKNEIVFSQGGVADAVFYIQRGNVKLVVVSKHGKEAVVAILGPGHFFGEGCLNGHSLRIATARSVDQCVITRLEKKTMIATRPKHRPPTSSGPGRTRDCCAWMAGSKRRWRRRLSARPATDRIASPRACCRCGKRKAHSSFGPGCTGRSLVKRAIAPAQPATPLPSPGAVLAFPGVLDRLWNAL